MWLIFCQQRLWPVVELLKYPLATSQSCIVPFPVRVCESESHIVLSDSLWPHGLYSPWNSLDQNTGVGSLSLLQGIFPTQGLNPSLPYCGQILYQLSHKGSPRILEWVACPFSRGSSWPRNQTEVSCLAGRFFINWAIRESPKLLLNDSVKPLQGMAVLRVVEKNLYQGQHIFS